jgi:succinate dehydrogenase flavin-adding protein (antitoxin of CptAB toxin-antitoxin module)
VDALERLAEAQDSDLYAWISGGAAVPQDYDTGLFGRLLAFNREKKDF